MKIYIASLAVGLLVGLIYGFLGVRSPAPPVIALVGLLGILLGEQLPPLLRTWIKPEAKQISWLRDHVQPHCFGQLPGAHKPLAGAHKPLAGAPGAPIASAASAASSARTDTDV